jgi:hypothetical protein
MSTAKGRTRRWLIDFDLKNVALTARSLRKPVCLVGISVDYPHKAIKRPS